MTPPELASKLNNDFGLGKWPSTYETDHETYANICQYIFWMKSTEVNQHIIHICIGKNCGIMFKGVELLLRKQ